MAQSCRPVGGHVAQPHHFQQELRHVERLVDARVASAQAYAWSIVDFQFDESLLALGKLGLARGSGVLPDGTPFAMPQFDPLLANLEIAADVKAEPVCLALPLQREGADEFALDTSDRGADMTRYCAAQEDVRDTSNVNDEPATIQNGRLQARLIRTTEALDAYATLAATVVVERRADGIVLLNRAHIPAQLRLDASKQLSSNVDRLQGVLRQRAEKLAGRLGQLGHGVSELAEFLMLQTLNRNGPSFAQHAASPVAHPRELHHDCLRLADELAMLASTRRLTARMPPYKRYDLRATFTPLFDELNQLMSAEIGANAVQIELIDRKPDVRSAAVKEIHLVKNASFVPAVNARMQAEQLRQRFPAQTTIAPVGRILDLVDSHLHGIGLRSLPVAPSQLPAYAGYYYFELDRGSELWAEFESNGSIGIIPTASFRASNLNSGLSGDEGRG